MLALWVVAALAAAALVAALLLSHGSSRKDVTNYIERVNAAGRTFAQSYRGVSNAYRSFTLAPQHSAQQLPRLREAARRLTQLRIELERIPAPPAAQRLRSRLIAFYRQQEAVGRELVGIAAYVPRLLAAERRLGPASTRMRAALAAARTPEQQATALRAYGVALAGAVRSVQAIEPPPLFAASHSAQIGHLERSTRAVVKLQHALLSHSRARVQAAVVGLQSVNGATSGASRAAVAAYNRHVARIRTLGIAVERERRRLEFTLG